MTDREALIAAVKSTRNLNEAARSLDVSRRTVQNRMREYGLPRGRGGRPKRSLVRHRSDMLATVVGLAALVGGGVLAYRWWASRQQLSAVAGEGNPWR